MSVRKVAVITDCTRECPHVTTERTIGAGCATDYLCKLVQAPEAQRDYRNKGRLIVGYVEWESERPKAGEFPEWCPLFEAEPGLFEAKKP